MINEIAGNTYHRIHSLIGGEPVFSLFHHGRRVKPWGFIKPKTGGIEYTHVERSDNLEEWEGNPKLWLKGQ